MTTQERKVLVNAIVHYGVDKQKNQAIEEMSELTKEICKANRGLMNLEHFSEEIADVEIMIEQLKIMYSVGNRVEEARKAKIERLENKIKNNEK